MPDPTPHPTIQPRVARSRVVAALLSGALGVGVHFGRGIVGLLDANDVTCCLWALLPPGAAAVIGWHLPRGAPFASIAATLLLVASIDWSPTFVGPTARSLWPLHVAAALVPCAVMFVCELLAAHRRLASDHQLATAPTGDADDAGG